MDHRPHRPRRLDHRFGGPAVVCAAALLAVLCGLGSPATADDKLDCVTADEQLVCTIEFADFADEIRDVLNNGWENVLEFNLIVYDANDDFVGVNFAELNTRCYIDPFDDPCLALWSGSESWQSYGDVDELIAGISRFQLVSKGADQLAGEYRAQLTITLNPITDQQADMMRVWLARHRGGHLVVGRGESSIFGTFVSVFANIRSGNAEASATLVSEPFDVP